MIILPITLVSSKGDNLNMKKSWNTSSHLDFLSHTATKEDIERMKASIGVRESNKDYNIIDGHGTGLAPPTEEEWNGLVGKIRIVDSLSASRSPDSVDLSKNPCFPKVGDQGQQGSCAAWAVTYYANGYQQALDKNWTDASTGNTEHLMSPAWAYNKVNYGEDKGSHTWSNAKLIQSVGSATWSTIPYSASDHISWGSESAWRNAPEYRCGDIYTVFAPFDNTTIDIVKNVLSNNHPVTFALHADSYAGLGAGDDTITSSEIASGYDHVNTIVGYDDNKTAGNETGAFKIVNSWGSNWGNSWGGNGYYWMTYKAFLPGKYAIVWFDDKPDYQPSLLGVWNLDPHGSRDASVTLGIGIYGSPEEIRKPKWDGGSYDFPSFMCLDITEFEDNWDAEINSFYLEIGLGCTYSNITSFRIEEYKIGYSPGSPTRVSNESKDVPKTTPCYVTVKLDNMLPHDFIYINGNKNFTLENGVTNGTGTKNNPYIIKHWEINTSNKDRITIKNTDAYFIIRHCFIHAEKNNIYTGIYLYNVTNGIIDSVILYNNYNGLVFNHSQNNNVTNCIIASNDKGISFYESSDNKIINSDIHGGSIGISINHSSNNITNCAVYNNSYSGIFLGSSSNNNITDCAVYDNSDGILLESSSNNNITDCAVYDNPLFGILLESSSNNNTITNCAAYNNDYGIRLYYSSNNNTITNCAVYNNNYGIYLVSSSNNNTITNCAVYNNYYGGIFLDSSSNNTITNCAVYNNSDDGIRLYDSSNNTITDCAVYNNRYDGIYLSSASNNQIHYCNIYGNTVYGIYNYHSEIWYQVSATYNWWGSPNGPGQNGANGIYGAVLYDPWLIESYHLPLIFIIQPEEGLITNQNVTLVYLIDAPFTSEGTPIPVVIDGPANGTIYTAEWIYNVVVTVIDGAGNSDTATVSFTVDKTPPTVTITEVLNGAFYNVSVTPVIEFEDINLHLTTITLNGEMFEGGNTITEEGNYTLFAQATDKAGNFATKTIWFVIDKTPPIIQISGIINNTYYNVNVTPTFWCSDINLYNVSATLNNETFINNTVVEDEGGYTLVVKATDKAGNIATQTIIFTIDKTKPIITISDVEDGAYYNTDVVPIIDITDDNLNITLITLNGNPFTSGTTISAENTYVLFVQADDKAGNTANKTISFVVDKPPRISINGVEDNAYYNVDILPIINVTDNNLNNTIVTLNNNVFIPGTIISAEGKYVLDVWADDIAGNTATKKIVFIIDKIKPVIIITNVTNNSYYNTAVTFMIKIVDENHGVALAKLNGIDFDPNARIMVIAEGKYTLVVQAVDKAGNTANKTIIFTIDKTKPILSDISPIDGIKTTKAIVVVSGKTEEDATVKINNEDVTVNEDGIFSKEINLVEGENIIIITATDFAGNTNTKTITIRKIGEKPAIIPGFETIILIATLGLALLLKRKR